jgi:hypothetical protein
MYRLPNGGAKKYLVTAVSLVLPALVVLWLGVGGSPPQSAGDFEQCVEQVEAKGPSKWGARCLMTTCNARPGWRKASGGYTYYDFMQDGNFDIGGALIRQERSANRSIASIWVSSMSNGKKLFRLNWQKDRTNGPARIWKARVSLSGH